MNKDLERACRLLAQGSYTCVLAKGETVLTDTRRGVRPLLELLDSGKNLCSFAAADRVVGKAAAFLYLLMGVSAVHARVISEPAREVLTRGGVALSWDSLVPAIQNRDLTGFCPMETAVWDISDPVEAKVAIEQNLRRLLTTGSDTKPQN